MSDASFLPGDGSPSDSNPAGGIIAGRRMREPLELVQRVASGRVPVILHGETGTGKEVLARLLHEQGTRAAGRLVRINCGALPRELIESTLFGHERGAFTGALQQSKGAFEEADGGTLFLDELGELPLAAQAALLRVLETGAFQRVGSSREISVDVRIVAATHRHLEEMVQAGHFRADLYYRLSTLVIELPPLREREDEIEPLAWHFLRRANESNGRKIQGFQPQTLALLQAYAWPGNVRELKNAIERAVVLARSPRISPDELPSRVRCRPGEPPRLGALEPTASPPPTLDLRRAVQEYEAKLLLAALEGSDWNQTEAARRLGVPVRTLAYRMKVLGVSRSGR